MTRLPLTLTLSLTALLSAALLLPGAALAHDRETTTRADRDHHKTHGRQERHRRQQRADNWYLLRHREARSYGHRSPQPLYRMSGKRHPRHQRHQRHDRHQT